MFQTHRSTGHRRSLPAGLDRPGQWPIPSAALAFVARGVGGQLIDCPPGVAPERMPKADATGLAPKESADYNPPAYDSFVREGLASAPRRFQLSGATHPSLGQSKIQSHSLVKSPRRRLWP